MPTWRAWLKCWRMSTGSLPRSPRKRKRETTLQKIEGLEGGAVGAVRDQALVHLARINDSIAQIAEGLGAPGMNG